MMQALCDMGIEVVSKICKCLARKSVIMLALSCGGVIRGVETGIGTMAKSAPFFGRVKGEQRLIQ